MAFRRALSLFTLNGPIHFGFAVVSGITMVGVVFMPDMISNIQVHKPGTVYGACRTLVDVSFHVLASVYMMGAGAIAAYLTYPFVPIIAPITAYKLLKQP